MKTYFATAAIAATYLAISAQGQNEFRLLQDNTCEPEAEATFKNFDAQCIKDGTNKSEKFYLKGLDERALCTDGNQIEIGLDNRAWVLKEASEYAVELNSIGGKYEIENFSGNKNDWHFADITVLDAEKGVFKWQNRAGVSWLLTRKENSVDKLDVGTDCPYYNSGYKEAMLVYDDDGKIIKLEGPGGALYKKTSDNVAKLNSSDGAFKANYLGGTLRYDVNVSDVGCNCAAGVFLVALDGDKCTMGEYESDSPPDCPTINVMKANKVGFKTQSHCHGNFCNSEIPQSDQYGAGSSYVINTLEPYSVQTQFFADANNELTSIKTTLSQYSGAVNNQITLEIDDCDFHQLGSKLDKNMGMAISTFSLDPTNNPLTDQCTEICSSGSTTISGLQWTEGTENDEEEEEEDSDESDSEEEEDEDEELVWGEAAPSLTEGECAKTNCFECRQSWYDSDPNAKEYRCKDETVYKYTNKCGKKTLKKEGMDLCMTGDDQLCFFSYPADDKKKNKSEKAACRSIPQDYIEGQWKFSKKEQKITKGLCRYGCEENEGTCHWSWPKGEKSNNNPKAMNRCKPKDQ